MASDASSGTYSAIARTANLSLPGASVATSRALLPVGFAGCGPTTVSQVQSSDHGMFNTTASAAEIPVATSSQSATRQEAPCQEGGERQQHSDTDPERHHDRHECGRGGEHERQECKCTGAMPEPGGEDAVGEVELVGAGIGSLDPRRTSGQVHEPGQGRKPDERREVTAAEDAWDERRPDVDDHAGDPCTVHREHGREAPRADRTHEVEPDDRHGLQQGHLEQRDHARDRQQGVARRQCGGCAEPTRIERLAVVRPEIAGTPGETEELPDGRHAVSDELAAADDDRQHDAHPGEQRAERRLPPSPHGGLGTDVGLGVPTSQVRGQSGTAAILQPEHLALGDDPLPADGAASADDRTRARDQANERGVSRPMPRRTGR